jgi:hypothetical protein
MHPEPGVLGVPCRSLVVPQIEDGGGRWLLAPIWPDVAVPRVGAIRTCDTLGEVQEQESG